MNFENLFRCFLRIGTEITCAKFRKNGRKTVGETAISEKKFDEIHPYIEIDRHNQSPII